jgi:fructuronate reductase
MDRLPNMMERLPYDRSAVSIGVVHLGLGAFHRAHQAVYFDDCLRQGDLRWGICAASLQRPDAPDALRQQDGVYTVAIKSGGTTHYRLIGSIVSTLYAGAQPDKLADMLASPDVHMITLTVTEKAYCRTGNDLDLNHPDIAYDKTVFLSHSPHLRTPIGWLALGLRRRRLIGCRAVTIACCDNLPSNGATLKRLVQAFLAHVDPDTLAELDTLARFPNTMVDRIVPATSDADHEAARQVLGQDDWGLVIAEPFSQWVIEDHFAGVQSPLGAVGVEIVPDVAPYELTKLRMLNGAHSTLAYIGQLAGIDLIAQVMPVPGISAFLDALWSQDVLPTLPETIGLDYRAYAATLVERFSNSGIAHRSQQIAMDGSQKLTQRLLGTWRDNLNHGHDAPHVRLAFAIWCRYVLDPRTTTGAELAINDPYAARFDAIRLGDPDVRSRCVELVVLLLGKDHPLVSDMSAMSALADDVSILLRIPVSDMIRMRYGESV